MMIFYHNKIRKIFSLEEIEIWHISAINYNLLLYSKNAKQHWLKEFMELKLGNLPAQAFTDKFNKACDKPGNKFNVYMEKNTS